MKSTTMDRSILLHRTPDDPVRTRLADALREATYTMDGEMTMGRFLSDIASRLGMTMDEAAGILGLRVQIVPDGVRACFSDECTHGPGYIPPAAGRRCTVCPDCVTRSCDMECYQLHGCMATQERPF